MKLANYPINSDEKVYVDSNELINVEVVENDDDVVEALSTVLGNEWAPGDNDAQQ